MGEVGPEKGTLSALRTQPLFSEPVLLPRPPFQTSFGSQLQRGKCGGESSVPLTLSSLSFWSLGLLCSLPFDLPWGSAFSFFFFLYPEAFPLSREQ